MCDHEQFMKRAIELARQTSLIDGAGGPFGCVIVKDGEIIAEGANRVLADHDPTSHGEMNAIREACKKLGTHDLSGCVLYTSGEPCPMCYAACHWAHIDAMYYASTQQDALEFGNFDDKAICESLRLPIKDRSIPANELMREEMLQVWADFHNFPDKAVY